ncbi:MAG TPA: hypothetical protein DEP72_02920 [Clostridiales bacterium]|nr:hypothetical protein [Clostridiales bacterium]
MSLRASFAKQSHLSKTRLLRRKSLLAMTRTRQDDGELNPKRLNKITSLLVSKIINQKKDRRIL